MCRDAALQALKRQIFLFKHQHTHAGPTEKLGRRPPGRTSPDNDCIIFFVHGSLATFH
jgi:hypothetical protein